MTNEQGDNQKIHQPHHHPSRPRAGCIAARAHLMAVDEKQGRGKRTAKTRKWRTPHTANDNAIAVTDDLPDAIPITEWELELLEAHLSDILGKMIPANDN